MTPPRTRATLVVSLAVLVAVAVAWLAWPDREGSADLVAVAPIPTTAPPSTSAPTSTSAPPASTTAPRDAGPVVPARVRVPAIGLDAPVVPVALRADGQMEVPGASEVGWYRLGPAPGAPGSAVLAAHVDFGGERGAFFDLRQVPVGAEVLVDGGGATRRFVVSDREQVAKADVDLGRYFTAEGPARITLITCGGAFDRGIGHYEDNIIVTAVATP